MITAISQLFDREIDWTEEVPGGVEFYAYVDGELCQLRMNDFPDEPLYTLDWKDVSVDFDDYPQRWKFSKP